jgi:hypothetical protein
MKEEVFLSIWPYTSIMPSCFHATWQYTRVGRFSLTLLVLQHIMYPKPLCITRESLSLSLQSINPANVFAFLVCYWSRLCILQGSSFESCQQFERPDDRQLQVF